MRLPLLTTTMLAFAYISFTLNAEAGPLVTISCEKPNGFNIEYGTPFWDSAHASEKNQPEPAPTFRGPTKDGYSATPMFIVDSNKKKMTAVWSELPEDAAARKK